MPFLLVARRRCCNSTFISIIFLLPLQNTSLHFFYLYQASLHTTDTSHIYHKIQNMSDSSSYGNNHEGSPSNGSSSLSPVIKRNGTNSSNDGSNPMLHYHNMAVDSPARSDASRSPPKKIGMHRTRSVNNSNSSSVLGIMRWVLLGIMIGSCGTGFLQSMASMNMETHCLNENRNAGGSQSSHSANNMTLLTPPVVHPLEQMRLSKAISTTGKETMVSRIRESFTAKNATLNDRNKNITPPIIEADEEAPFVNLPPPPTLNQDESFAACLVIKDDNHWLIEWLAYHYHVMPLRNIIIALDPEAKTSPRNILRRWSSRKLMNVTIWEDKHFMPSKIGGNLAYFGNNTGLMMHRARQGQFYRNCISTFRDRGMEWLMLVDTDEYILPSYASGYFSNLTKQVSFKEPGNVLRLLHYQEQVKHDNATCIYMPRFFFGAQHHPREKRLVRYHAPPEIDAMNMVTQRYLFRESKRNHNGKNLLNLKRAPKVLGYANAHHISQSVCPDPEDQRALNQHRNALIRVHHYLGSQEQYFFRDDPRAENSTKTNSTLYNVRGIKRYDRLNKRANHEDHAAKGWITGFVQNVGLETAVELLEGVGKVEAHEQAVWI